MATQQNMPIPSIRELRARLAVRWSGDPAWCEVRP
jgi:hypothetical protein